MSNEPQMHADARGYGLLVQEAHNIFLAMFIETFEDGTQSFR
ncbi:hypothetical protein [Scytonema hofmannii]|nr:hypothetical protein [Scytonema hofmannii]